MSEAVGPALPEKEKMTPKQRELRRQKELQDYDGQHIFTGVYADYKHHDGSNTIKNNQEVTWVAWKFNQVTGRLDVGHSNFRLDKGQKPLTAFEIRQLVNNDSHYETARGRLEKRTLTFHLDPPIDEPPPRSKDDGEKSEKKNKKEKTPFDTPKKHQLNRFRRMTLTRRDVMNWPHYITQIAVAHIRKSGLRVTGEDKDVPRTPIHSQNASEIGDDDQPPPPFPEDDDETEPIPDPDESQSQSQEPLPPRQVNCVPPDQAIEV